MGKTLTWTLLGVDKSSPAFQKVAKNVDAAADRLNAFGKDGTKALGEFKPAAAGAKAAAEDMAEGMSDAVEKAAARMAKARQSEADQLGRLRVAQTQLLEITQNTRAKASQLAAAEERVAAAHRKVESAQASVVAAQRKLNAEREKAIADAAADSDTDATLNIDVRGGIDRIKAFALAELKSAGIVGGAALAGGIAAGISSVGAAGMFIGIAAAAQSQNEHVAAAYKKLWEEVKAGAYEASGVLADDFIGGAERLGRTFNELRPQMREAFTASQPAVNDLYDGVTRLAQQAMPGLATGAKASALASDNVADAMESTGRAITSFITEASEGAEAGGESITAFGRIVERMGSLAGRILADLANSSTMVFPALESTVDAAAGALENVSDTVLPGLASSAALGLSGLTLLLNLFSALVSVLGPVAPQILTVVTALKLIDAVTFGGVTRSWNEFKGSISAADGPMGKTKAGVLGVVGSLGPMGIAAGIGALALDSLSRSQQRAAQEAQDHRARVQSLADVLRASNGVIDANVRALASKKLAETEVSDTGKTVVEVARAAGINLRDLEDAYLGNETAQKRLSQAVREYLEVNGQAGPDEITDNLFALEQMMPGLIGEFGKAKQQNDDFAKSSQGAAAAVKEQADALQKLRDQIDAMVNKDLSYRNSVDATAEAQKSAAEALKEHGVKSDEFADATRNLEGAYIAQAQAARDLAMANSTATDELVKGKEGALAYTQEVLKMAQAAGNNAPRSLQMMVAKLQETDLTALGATRKVNELGQTVITLPNGKTIVVDALDRASAAINSVANRRYTALIHVDAVFRRTPDGVVLNSRSAFGNAEGGWIRGPGTSTSDSIPRMLSDGEFVVRASEAKKHGAMLEALNAGKPIPLPAGLVSGGSNGGGSGGGGGPIVLDINLYLDGGALLTSMRKEIRTRGGDPVKVLTA